MNLTSFASIFGVVFIAVGILGFVPAAAPDGHLLGIFHVNAAHNIVHVLSGIAALVCAGAGQLASQRYFQIFGVIYGAVAILGLVEGEGYLLGLIANNVHDVWLHILISVVSLYLGFAHRRAVVAASTT